MERFGGLERKRPKNQESTNLTEALENLLINIEDPFLRAILEAIIEKIHLKNRIADIIQYRDNTSIYQRVKQLGIFLFIDSESKYDWKDPNSDFYLAQGEKFIDIHLPPINDPEKKKKS